MVGIFHLKYGNQNGQILAQTLQCRRIQLTQCVRQHASKRPRRLRQQDSSRFRDMQVHHPTIPLITRGANQALLAQGTHQIAGRRLVYVHRTSQCTDLGSWLARHNAQRPQLRPAQSRMRLNTLKMRFDSVEHNAELTQNSSGLVRQLNLAWMACDRTTGT